MGQELQVPAAFQNRGVSKVFQGHLNPEDRLSDNIGQGFPVMHIKGKVWTLQYRGERKMIVREDDGSPSSTLDVVILKQAPTLSKLYYKDKFDPQQSAGMPPTCASLNAIVPDENVPEKQSESCILCPRNVWKSDQTTGRRGRECTDRKRIAILVMPNQTTPVFGAPVVDPVLLDVPPDSFQSMAQMGDVMERQQGMHYSTYLTRITFDPNKAHPSLVFRPMRPLEDTEAQAVVKLLDDPTIPRIIGAEAAGPKVVGTYIAGPAPGMSAPSVPLTMAFAAAPAEPTPTPTPTPAPTPAPAPAPAPVQAKRTRGPNKPRPAGPAAAQPQTNGHSLAQPDVDVDTGTVAAADDDLDNEIASMIQKAS